MKRFIEEEYDMNVGYLSESGGLKIIVDSGAPMSKFSEGWFKKYVKERYLETSSAEFVLFSKRYFCFY